MTTFGLVAAGSGHGAVMSALHGVCFDQAGETPWDAQALTALLAMPGARAFIARATETPLGFVLARRAADEGEIITIGTLPAFRRRGVAAALLDRAIDSLVADGAARIYLEVAADNAAAVGFYRARGFTRCGARPAYYRRAGGAIDAQIMVLEIAAGKVKPSVPSDP